MKEIFNKTTIYSTIFIGINFLLILCLGQLVNEFYLYWVKSDHMLGDPLPWGSDKLIHNYGIPFLFLIMIFIFTALMGIKKGKAREIAFHTMMLSVIFEIFLLLYMLIALTMPLMSMRLRNGG